LFFQVKHFDRRREYVKFRAQIDAGYNPLGQDNLQLKNGIFAPLSLTSETSRLVQVGLSGHQKYYLDQSFNTFNINIYQKNTEICICL
jgi:hypothetical protein